VKTYSYDAKDKLIGVSTTESDVEVSSSAYSYNVSGIRDSKIEGGVTTSYVVDSNRDYAQVLEEIVDGLSTVTYSYGHDLLSQSRSDEFKFYQYDGLGSTRGLSNSAGAITDSYNYEAFGDVLNETGSTDNNYKFTGEQFDSSLDQYYLRARYYDQGVGRFTQQDTYMGNSSDPVSLHKYIYGNADPVRYTDPSGKFGITGAMATNTMIGVLAGASIAGYSIGQGLAGGGASDGGFTSSQLGWLTIAGMVGHSSSFLDLISAKVSERDDADETIRLSRVVEDVELASMYSCNCFSLGPNLFPKQFFHTDAEAISFGTTFILGKVREPRFHLINTTISRRMYNSLDHEANEPGIGPIVTVPNGLLPAFNFDASQHGGWQFSRTF
jgi:RHS repeat-associated protein